MDIGKRSTVHAPGAARLLAAFLVLAFALAIFSTNPSHCQDACDSCPTEMLTAVEHHECPDGTHARAPELALHAAGNSGCDLGSESCAGASCLCHQPRIPAALEAPRASTPFTLATIHAPARPNLDVTEEILHIPKRTA